MAYKWKVLLVMVVASFMVLLDTTVVNVALPSIMRDFEVNLEKAQLVITMYLLAIALVIPLTGYLSDRFGTKRLFIFCITGFTAGAALSSISWDINSLIFFRVIQGIGGGIIMPLGIALVFRSVSREEQGTMIAIAGVPIVLAPVIGPILSGVLVESSSWRFIWLPHLPVGVLGIVLSRSFLRETDIVRKLAFDYKGFILAGIGFSLALIALTQVSQEGWTSELVLGLFLLSGVALLGWVYVELREETPLLDLRIFKNITYAMAAIVYFVSTLIMFAALFLLPVFLQNVRGLSPIETGLLLMPEAIALGVTLLIAGRLYDRFGPLPVIVPGLLGLAYSMWLLHSLDVTTSDGDLVMILILRGASMGMMALPAFTLAMSVHPVEALARASALTNVLRQLFPAFGIALFATLLQSRFAFHFSTIAQTVTPDSLAAMQVLSSVGNAVGQFGASDAVTNRVAVQVLDGMVQQRASVAAFQDVFLIATGIVLLGLIPSLLLRKPKAREVAQPATASAAVPEPAD
ncbi:MAG: hypothetical protein BZY75_00820 [SAR202 cluster bacterium Io17-Chloro-G7]|nr:MAG: hypothetical protein BZY75_00820 [SAR202 cluster bacterium Io17-Chloro-G7]